MTDTWNAVLDDLSKKVSAHNFESWFKNIGLHHLDEVSSTAFLEVADDFYKAWIEDNYADLIEHSLHAVRGTATKAKIEVRGFYQRTPQPVASTIDAQPQMAAHQLRVDQKPLSLDQRALQVGLNPKYTFDEFVVGGSNQFVHAACSAVAANPAQTYNPLFIFGGVGLGKTHLLQAIGLETLRRNPAARVMYLSTEEFMNQMIMSLRNKDMNNFRNRFRDNCDLLLIDDIQFVGGKDSTQEEFFHTFNALYNHGKQIVITSDKSPKDLPGIEERLASRFAWGLSADIQVPTIETRLAILEKKADADGIRLEKDVAMLIATSVRSNVRELEGMLIRLGASAKLTNSDLNVDFVRDMLTRMNIEHNRQVTAKRIIKLVASYFDIKPSDIKGPSRAHAISKPRQIAMYLARKHTNASFPQLGREFSKDHSTVITAHRKMTALMEKNEDPLVQEIVRIESTLLNA